MSPLGRGLASLIPRRSEEEVGEALEQIDSLEIEESTEPAAPNPPMPDKPKITPLDPAIFLPADQPLVDTVHKRTFLTVKQLADDAPDEPLVRRESKVAKSVPKREEALKAVVRAEKVEEQQVVEEEDLMLAPATPVPPPARAAKTEKWDSHEEKVVQIAIGDIQINPNQPRRAFDEAEMQELIDSIDEHGILQPLVVRRVAPGKYELIAGERRLRAAKHLQWERVPAVVKTEVAGQEKTLVYALIENIQREDLNPLEEALAYERLNKEFGMTHEEIGAAMGTSRVRITNAMRVLQLPAEIQRGLAERKITEGHAKAILMIPDPEKQIRFYHHLVEEGLTVRKAEVRARRIQRAMKVDDPMRTRRRRDRHPISVKYRPYLEERYGFNADVKYIEQKNRYEVVFRAYNDGEVQELLDRLLGKAPLPENVDADVLGEDELDEDEE